MSEPDDETGQAVLFCTDALAERRGAEFSAIVPGLTIVPLVGDAQIDDHDLSRINLACFSADAFPEHAPRFMQVCLQSPRLRWFHTFSAGVDHPVFGAFTERGVILTTSSGASASPIAQTVMMYLLALTRGLHAWFHAQSAHRWEPHRIGELEGRSIGVVGMGPIGLEIIRLAEVFGMRPIGMRRQVRGDESCETWPLGRFAELASTVDVLVIAIPLSDTTRGLVDRTIIESMRPGALFVNIARGEIVDEDALSDALRAGHLGGAALDVFATEPLPADSPLWDLPNTIVTPHSSGASDLADERSIDVFADNLRRLSTGRPLRNVV